MTRPAYDPAATYQYKTTAFPFESAATVDAEVKTIEGVDATDALEAAAQTGAAAAIAAVDLVDTGITIPKTMEMLAAFLAGKVSRVSVDGVTTLSYKKRDGTTVSFTAPCNEDDGDRDTTGDLS